MVTFCGLDPVANEAVIELTVFAEADGELHLGEVVVLATVCVHVAAQYAPIVIDGGESLQLDVQGSTHEGDRAAHHQGGAFVFPDPDNPFSSTFPEIYTINEITGSIDIDVIGIKTGDVNKSAVTTPFMDEEPEYRSTRFYPRSLLLPGIRSDQRDPSSALIRFQRSRFQESSPRRLCSADHFHL